MSRRVLFFGIYDPQYSRNSVLMQGFHENGWEILECRVDPKMIKGVQKYIVLWRQGRELAKEKYDLVLVAFPGHTVVWLAHLIFGKRVIVDLFLSLYDSNVFDRKLYSKYSLGALRDYVADWSAVHLAKWVLLDTYQHIDYISKLFNAKNNKFVRVLIGAPDLMFAPKPKIAQDSFIVHFHGMFIPLQGIEYILEAANILRYQDINWNIVGKGQLYKEMEAKKNALKLDKVFFKGLATLPEVASYIADADVCLGIFGNTDKTTRVIPNKVYECVAMGRPVITALTPAILEIFTDREDVLLCQVASGQGLADSIMMLYNDSKLRDKIATGARRLYAERLKPKYLVLELLQQITT